MQRDDARLPGSQFVQDDSAAHWNIHGAGVWLPIAVGLLAMYVPSYINLSATAWTRQDQSHGPLVLLIVLFLFWNSRHLLLPVQKADKARTVSGVVVLVIGLLMYIIGRSQDILILDLGSQIPVLTGTLLLIAGFRSIRGLAFPLFFMLFLLPLPGFIIDTLTMPMKIGVSYVAEQILYLLGYPVARSGVVLHIGPYQLLVADACAGLQTLISLEAMGLLYLHLVRRESLVRNVALAIMIIPISFTANVIRVMALTVITYHFGDEVGRGFMHDFAGLLLFTVALLLVILVDFLMQKTVVKHRSPDRIRTVPA